jgi:hypothetical protein
MAPAADMSQKTHVLPSQSQLPHIHSPSISCLLTSSSSLLSFLYLQPTNINYKAPRAYSPLSVGSASPPTKYFSSMLGMEDFETPTLSPESPPWPQHKG